MFANCTPAAYAVNKGRMVRLAEYSRDCMKLLRDELSIDYEGRQLGTLQLFRSQAQLDASKRDIEVLEEYGVPYQSLDAAGCERAEAALARVRGKIVGGLRLPGDETGDCFRFTKAMAAEAQRLGVSSCSTAPSTRSSWRRTRRGGAGRRAALQGRRHRLCPRQLCHRVPAPARSICPSTRSRATPHPADDQRRGLAAQYRAGRNLQGGHHPFRRADPSAAWRSCQVTTWPSTRNGTTPWPWWSAISSPRGRHQPRRLLDRAAPHDAGRHPLVGPSPIPGSGSTPAMAPWAGPWRRARASCCAISSAAATQPSTTKGSPWPATAETSPPSLRVSSQRGSAWHSLLF